MTTATSNLEQAARTFIARRDRTAHPTGKFDNAGRWYPSESETCSCCSSVRSPSRSYPYSYMTHCRTMAHVANLYGVSVSELRKEVRRLDPDSAPAKPTREGGEHYFKAVRRITDELFVSIHDGNTTYQIGKEMRERARQQHGGGFYAYRSIEAAIKFARTAEVDDFEIIQVECGGHYCVYGDKLAFSYMKPVAVVGPQAWPPCAERAQRMNAA
jgi:hypothetical protein